MAPGRCVIQPGCCGRGSECLAASATATMRKLHVPGCLVTQGKAHRRWGWCPSSTTARCRPQSSCPRTARWPRSAGARRACLRSSSSRWAAPGPLSMALSYAYVGGEAQYCLQGLLGALLAPSGRVCTLAWPNSTQGCRQQQWTCLRAAGAGERRGPGPGTAPGCSH